MQSKKAQVTLFVIIGIIIVISVILLFSLFENPISTFFPPQTVEPTQIVSECIDNNIKEVTDYMIIHNFYLGEPRIYKSFGYNLGKNDEIPFDKYPYLCYTDKYYAKCIVQEPALISFLEKQVTDYLKPKIAACFDNLKSEMIKDGYSVQIDKEGEFSVEMISRGVKVKVAREMIFVKADSQKNVGTFSSVTQTPIYDLAITAQEIVRQEAKWCNSDYVMIMRNNPKIEINKFQTGDDNKIYTVKDTLTGKVIRFAIRGCVLKTPA
ncbi:MAG TPA: hypothetical protein P5277_02765 [Candidatus Paceibacterota bacterium]|nr:hypothetical protein [Candidatus Paceibacterota bacterium]